MDDQKQILPELKFDKKRNRVKNCPCGKSNNDGKFIPYVGYDNKGYCHSCEETFLPEIDRNDRRYFFANPLKAVKYIPTSYIDFDLVTRSFKQYERNNFVKYLHGIFGFEITKSLVQSYFLGTSKIWDDLGAVIFWYLDYNGNVRSGKVMAYNEFTGKRLKDPNKVYVTWVHKILNLKNFNLDVCYFGEHLLKENNKKPIALVESEKTAIIASIYFPEYVWIASGGLGNIKMEKSDCFYDRDIVLFPDLSKDGSSFQKWNEKAEEIKLIANSVYVVDILEKFASNEDKINGLDIVDFLTRVKINDWNDFELIEKPIIEINEHGYPASWDIKKEIQSIHKPETKLQKFKLKNPVLTSLLDRFGLIEL
jgi:hypothetical protein